jgi:hypothetical protein
VAKVSVFGVDVLDSLVNTVLTNILRRESVFVGCCAGKGHSVVHVVDVFLGPLSEVANKSIQIVALGHVNSTLAIEVLNVIHQQESHILIVNVEDKGGTRLVDFLGQVGGDHLYKS